MRDGFLKAAVGTPKTAVADCRKNADEILRLIGEMEQRKAKLMVFPELCITGYTCGDLFWQKALLEAAREELLRIAAKTKQTDALIFVGLPFAYGGKLYNIAAALNHGAVLGIL